MLRHWIDKYFVTVFSLGRGGGTSELLTLAYHTLKRSLGKDEHSILASLLTVNSLVPVCFLSQKIDSFK